MGLRITKNGVSTRGSMGIRIDFTQHQKLPKWYRERQQRQRDEGLEILDEVLDDLRVLESLRNDYLELRDEVLKSHQQKFQSHKDVVVEYPRDKELEIRKLMMVV